MKSLDQKFEVLGIRLNAITLPALLQVVEGYLEQKKSRIICTVNTEFIITAQKDIDFKEILNEKSSLNVCDGIGPLWAIKFLSFKELKVPILRPVIILIEWILSVLLIPIFPSFYRRKDMDRIIGANLVWDIAKIAMQKKYKLFLLGGAPTVAERAALKLQTELYGLKIAGVHSGNPETDTKEMLDAINKSRADIILVAFGHGKQEKWLDKNLSKTLARVGIGLGGTFDFIAEKRKRAPKFIQKIGLEWFYRLIQEPSRIKRQLSIPKFMWLVLLSKLKGQN